jgi:hypothetical protein
MSDAWQAGLPAANEKDDCADRSEPGNQPELSHAV